MQCGPIPLGGWYRLADGAPDAEKICSVHGTAEQKASRTAPLATDEMPDPSEMERADDD